MKKNIIKGLFLLFLVQVCACKKFLAVGPPSNQIASETVFLTEETATAAINGLYTTLSNSNLYFASGGATVYLGLYGDELSYTSTLNNVLEFANSKLSISNSYITFNFWAHSYQTINQANSCISGLRRSNLNPELISQMIGEAHFIRAYCYWSLLNQFGDVPLVLTAEDYEGVSKMSRTPNSQVLEQILADLQQAKNLLKPDYPTAGRYRVNYFTVMAFLSRVHTYLGNWNQVLSSSNEVIAQTTMYNIESDLNRTFLIGSTEAIWQTATGNATTNTYEANAFIPAPAATIRPSYPLQPSLYDAFSVVDKRKSNWIATKTVSGVTYRYPYKYKLRPITPKSECQMMIRLAEVFLNRAEAKAHLNDPTAVDDLNKTRLRAGIGNLSGLAGQALIDAVIEERRLELFAEWGLRWFDLKRLGKLDQVLMPLKPEWRSTASLFPIPNAERMTAPNLTQNPGYNN